MCLMPAVSHAFHCSSCLVALGAATTCQRQQILAWIGAKHTNAQPVLLQNPVHAARSRTPSSSPVHTWRPYHPSWRVQRVSSPGRALQLRARTRKQVSLWYCVRVRFLGCRWHECSCGVLAPVATGCCSGHHAPSLRTELQAVLWIGHQVMKVTLQLD